MKPVSDSTMTDYKNTSGNYTSVTESLDDDTSDNYDDSGYPTVSVYIISCCYGVTSVVGIIGNGLILLVFFVERKLLRNNFNLLILNLTVTDLCIAMLDLPLQVIANQLGYWPFGVVECALLVFCDWGMTFMSIFTLVAISVDRYWAACWSQSYRIQNTRKRTLICIALIWLLLMVTWTPAYLIDRIRVGDELQFDCDFSLVDNHAFAFCIVVAGYHVPSCIMIFCYAKVYLAVRRARQTVTPLTTKVMTISPAPVCVERDSRSVDVTTPDGTHPKPIASISRQLTVPPCPAGQGGVVSEKAESCRREMRVFRSLSYIVAAYLVLWTPCHLVVDMLCFDADLVSGDLYSFVSVLCYLNSALNPMLYAASNEQMRRALRRIFCFGRRRRCINRFNN